ncbi:nucleoporin Ndc1 [Drosophila tropicalis]|uniref:nucleoporin Ndc1 n=1 Tax=Drosophila tropicalis TaxID=46794 RepID=UPI0035AC244E
MPTATSSDVCKLLLLGRCLRAVVFSVIIQFLLLTIFLLFVNFQLLHPLNWVASTFSLVCSLYTWFASIPLITAIVLYGVILCQEHLVERRYHPSRYRWLQQHGLRKLMFLGAHLMVGYLTAWLYTGYMHTDYRHLMYKCYGSDCLSGYHIFLLGMGTTAGCYYFVSVYLNRDVRIEFSVVDQSRSHKMRQLLYGTLLKSLTRSLVPTLGFTLVFWLCGSLVGHKLSQLLGVDTDERLEGFFGVVTSIRLIFYAWLLTAQILSNMHLMRRFYAILLTEDLPLVVSKNRTAFAQDQEVTVVAGLGVINIYVVQCLSASFLFKLAHRKDSGYRQELFQLTEPGNRPANWRAFCDQSLSIIGGFTDELTDSMQQISMLKVTQNHFPVINHDSASAALLAEKVLLRQYNHLHGIRPIVSPRREQQSDDQPVLGGIRHMPNWCERVSLQLQQALKRLLQRIPGIAYLFSEPDGAKAIFLLSNSLPIVWLSEGLAQICVASLTEDIYGVVQNDLPAIIKALSSLKDNLDKLASVVGNLSGSDTENFSMLRGAVRRSLYNVGTCFNAYLGDLIDSPEELRMLKSFIHQD